MAIEKSKNSDAFVDFERAGWANSIAGYDEAFGSVSRQTVAPMLDAAGVRAGAHVLDVCTGPGMLVQAAIERGAKATGLDFPKVVELAQKLVPTGEFRAGDAQALPFPDDTFDAVVCGYGVIHLPEPEMALREMMRVLRPGGRAGISVWENTTPNNGFSLVYAAVRAHGRMDVSLPHGPDYFQFSTDAKMRAALSDIGFTDVQTKFVEQYWRVKSGAQILDAMASGTVRARALLAAQDAAATEKIRGFFEQTLAGLGNADADGFRVPLPALVGSGAKP